MFRRVIFTFIFLITLSFGDININDDMSDFKSLDQFDKVHKVMYKTKYMIFVFEKASGHTMKDFLAKKDPNYLSNNNALFIADVSAIPTFIKWFALHSLKNYPYPIVVLDDEELSSKYIDENNIEKIMLVTLKDKIVTSVKYFDDIKILQVLIER